MREVCSVVGLAAFAAMAVPAGARHGPAVPAAKPPLHRGYVPNRTAWGDPDLRATWTTNRISEAGIPLERPAEAGNRLWLTDAEFAKRLEAAKKSDAGYRETVDADGTRGSPPGSRRTRSAAAAR